MHGLLNVKFGILVLPIRKLKYTESFVLQLVFCAHHKLNDLIFKFSRQYKTKAYLKNFAKFIGSTLPKGLTSYIWYE